MRPFLEPDQVLPTADAARGGTLRSHTTTLTVDLARALWGRYPRNRELDSDVVSRYIADVRISAGDGGRPVGVVAFDQAGEVVAGKYVIHAVIETGIPALVWVDFNAYYPG